jgi:sigma-B regulation protein RsbU (phosphoserine phosphatase)
MLKERHVLQQEAFLAFSEKLLTRRALGDIIGYLVEEARQILYADACALLLPGKDPGFLEFRATSGWRVDPAADRRRVPITDDSGPGLVIRTQRPLLAPDIQETDPTPWSPTWIQEEGFHGHAIMPLVENGRSVGVVVIDHRQPYQLDEDDLYCLRLMANQAAIAIESARFHEEEVRMLAMDRELEVGRQIQLSMLPTAPPEAPGWEFSSFYEPAREVGGDFYDFFELPGTDNQLGVVIADVTGKGVPAALFMARASTLIRSAALSICQPGPTLVKANAEILQDRRTESLLTALYAVLDTATGRLTFANAGHCRPLLLRASSGETQEFDTGGLLLGAFAEIELDEEQIEMAPGDALVLYSDGVSEAMNAQHSPWGTARLRTTLANAAGASANQLLKAIVSAVKRFRAGMEQSDDLTLIVIRRAPAK